MKSCTILLPLLLTVACGEAPVPVEEEIHFAGDGHDHGPAEAHSPDDGHDHGPDPSSGGPGGVMPQDDIHAAFQAGRAAPASQQGMTGSNPHAPSGAAVSASFGGLVRLTGERAAKREGYLFVSVVPAGTSAPACFDRLDLSDNRAGKLTEGVLSIPFAYRDCPAPEGDLELKVQFDLDGFVETKEEGSLVGRFPIIRGDEAIDVTLE